MVEFMAQGALELSELGRIAFALQGGAQAPEPAIALGLAHFGLPCFREETTGGLLKRDLPLLKLNESIGDEFFLNFSERAHKFTLASGTPLRKPALWVSPASIRVAGE